MIVTPSTEQTQKIPRVIFTISTYLQKTTKKNHLSSK